MEERRLEEERRLKEVRRARRKQVLIRGVMTAFGVVALSGGIAVGISSFVSDDGSDIGGDATPGHIAPRKATDRLLARSTVADPQNGPLWGLSTYTSQQNEDCVIAARVVNGRMGVINHGKFTAFRKNVSGFCDDLSRDHLMFTVRRYSRSNGARTLLFGQAEREVQRIVLQQPRNRRDVHVSQMARSWWFLSATTPCVGRALSPRSAGDRASIGLV